MIYATRTIVLLNALLFVVACERSFDESSPTDQALEELQKFYEEAKANAPNDPIAWAKEDLQRAGDWEYRVVAVSAGQAKTTEDKLNEFGRERWEVFWVREQAGSMTIFMKRPARSYLMSAPLSEIGKAVSGAGSNE